MYGLPTAQRQATSELCVFYVSVCVCACVCGCVWMCVDCACVCMIPNERNITLKLVCKHVHLLASMDAMVK